ncbi:hypothetical protein ISF_04238 [Cordyceps fumosorosea ARSEF 2679]|uniref:Cell wall beta-glucan synthesis n=1 Tax=Cordyceps fumosorosea (strain ARSEF 2679) TaxID=1081104 RepID=A0A167XD45_CORFA|nr:hypothetical protein ISF_04238 [Cordyceps fumosorosea ARSEF 2679]OAA64828.1 hypothetical protein ISF_04238 [Cordyceps fumosorosea ARSEF 2679]
MRFQQLWAGVAFASATAAQFIFPDSSSSVTVNKAIQIQWNKSGLQAPISINLVPAGTTIRQDIVLKQVAGNVAPSLFSPLHRASPLTFSSFPVNIGNVGILQWTADETISAFPKFAMVITDASSQVIVSQPFPIGSLTRQPTQQIDLGDGNAGKKSGGNKQSGNDAQKQNNGGDNKNNKDDSKNANKDANKDASKGNKSQDSKGKDQTDKAADKGQSKDDAKNTTTLLPLPGLPTDNAAPVSLKPLPNAAVAASPPTASPTSPSSAAPAEGQKATETPNAPAAPAAPAPAAPAAPEAAPAAPPAPEATPPAPAPAPAAPEAAPAAPAAPKPEPAAPAAAPTSTSSISEVAKESATAAPAAADPAPQGFVTLSPAATSTSGAKAAVAASPAGLQNQAEAVVAGGSFREQSGNGDASSSPATLLPLPSSRAGEDPSTLLPLPNDKTTITTAITPRPPSEVSSESAAAAASETAAAKQSAAGGSEPTALAEKNAGAEQRRRPSLVLGLLGVAAGWAVL